jgi:hypothetical protein
MSDPAGSGLPLGGTGLGPRSYADFVAKEYLGDYLRAGGSAVRFVVAGDPGVAAAWHNALAGAADAEGYLHVGVDAVRTKVHLIDAVYAALAVAVDWSDLAHRQVRALWRELGMPAGDEVTVSAVATSHEVSVPEAARSMRRALETEILSDRALAREFRVAVLRLCQAALGTGDVLPAERDALIDWLRGERVPMRLLRSVGLPGPVGRHNARALLMSLAAWRSRVAGTGIVLDLDLSRLMVARRPPLEDRVGLYYSKAAVLDAYEVLRQLVDATDTLRSSYVAVCLPPEAITDEGRGLPAYSALHLRVVDEVRDRRRANPFAALVRLSTRMEVFS